jgi:hypothetical protein
MAARVLQFVATYEPEDDEDDESAVVDSDD